MGHQKAFQPKTAEPAKEEGRKLKRKPSNSGIGDKEAARAQKTLELLKILLPALGLDEGAVNVSVDGSAQRIGNAYGVKGAAKNGAIYLRTDSYDPETRSGRYLLAHEAAHVAQMLNSGNSSMGLLRAEVEADEIGAAFSRGQRVTPPVVPLAAGCTAFYSEDIASLRALVKQTRSLEIDEISKKLNGMWVSDSDVEEILKILRDMPFHTAHMVIDALSDEDRQKLIDNFNIQVHQKYREQILAVYYILSDYRIQAIGKKLIEGMELPGLSPEGTEAAVRILKNISQQDLLELLKSENGAGIRSLMSQKPAGGHNSQSFNEALTAEKKLQEEKNEFKLLAFNNHEIDDIINGYIFLRSDASSTITRIEQLDSSEKARCIAYALKEAKKLDDLIDEAPETMYSGKMFRVLLAAIPVERRLERAEKLISRGILSDWVITDREAKLAYAIVKSLPLGEQYRFRQREGGMLFARLEEENAEASDNESYHTIEVAKDGNSGFVDSASKYEGVLSKGSGRDILEYFEDLCERGIDRKTAPLVFERLKGLVGGKENEKGPDGKGENNYGTIRDAVIRKLDTQGYIERTFEVLEDDFILGHENKKDIFNIMLCRDSAHLKAHAKKLAGKTLLAVTARDAYLAFQIIKALPAEEQEAFIKSGGGTFARIFDEMTGQMMTSEELNFYTGGENGTDKAFIQLQLLNCELWSDKNIQQLDSYIRMAIAAGEHRWVFEQSEAREAYKNDRLRDSIVEKYRLYNPEKKRLRYEPEKILPTRFEQEGVFQSLSELQEALAGLGKDGLKLDTIKGVAELFSGKLKGIRFTRADERDGQKPNDFKLSRIASKVLLVEIPDIQIDSVNYFLGGRKLQTGKAGGKFSIKLDFGEPMSAAIEIPDLYVEDMLLVSRDSMISVNKIILEGFSASMQMTERLGKNWWQEVILLPLLYGLKRIVRIDDGNINSQLKNMQVSLNSFSAGGIAGSDGKHVDKIKLDNLFLFSGVTRGAYLRAKEKALNAWITEAKAAGDAYRVEVLKSRLLKISEEAQEAEKEEKELSELKNKQESSPGNFSLEESERLGELEKKHNDTSGFNFDISGIDVKGVDWGIRADAFGLRDFHGEGGLAAAGLEPVTDTEFVRRFVSGEESVGASDGMAAVSSGVMEITGLTLQTPAPAIGQLDIEIAKLEERYREIPRDSSYWKEYNLLNSIKSDINEYNSLANEGVGQLSKKPEKMRHFRELANVLVRRDWLSIKRVYAEGLSAGAARSGGKCRLDLSPVDIMVEGLEYTDAGQTAISTDKLKIKKMGGVLKADGSEVAIEGFGIEEIDVKGINYTGGGKHICTRNMCKLKGIKLEASISRSVDKKDGSAWQPGHATVKLFEIAAIEGSEISYSSGSTNVSIKDKAVIGMVRATDFQIDLEGGFKIERGFFGIDSISSLRLAAELEKGLKASANISAKGLYANFMGDGKRIFGLESFSVENGHAEQPGILKSKFSLAEFGGAVIRDGNNYRLLGFGLDSVKVEKTHWSGGGKEIRINNKAELNKVTADISFALDGAGLKDIKINALSVGRMYAGDVFLHFSNASRDKKDTPQGIDISLKEAVLEDLAVRDFDAAKMKGSADVRSLDIKELGAEVTREGKKIIEGTVSFKGSDLNGKLRGPGEISIDFNDISDLAVSASTAEGTGGGLKAGKLSGSFEMGKDFIRLAKIKVETPIDIKDVVYAGSGFKIKLPSARVGNIILKNFRLNYADVDKDGKKQQVLKSVKIDGFELGNTFADDLTYEGKVVIDEKSADGKTGQRVREEPDIVEAKKIKLEHFSVDKLDMDLLDSVQINRLKAGLNNLNINMFEMVFLDSRSIMNLFVNTKVESVSGSIDVSALKLGGDGPWTLPKGSLELKSGKLKGPQVIYLGKDGKMLELAPPVKRSLSFLELDGIDLKLEPNGTAVIKIDKIEGSELLLKKDKKSIAIPFLKLKAEAARLKGLEYDNARKQLVVKAGELSTDGLSFHIKMRDISGKSEEPADKPASKGGAGEPFILDALSGTTGEVSGETTVKGKKIQIYISIEDGKLDMEKSDISALGIIPGRALALREGVKSFLGTLLSQKYSKDGKYDLRDIIKNLAGSPSHGKKESKESGDKEGGLWESMLKEGMENAVLVIDGLVVGNGRIGITSSYVDLEGKEQGKNRIYIYRASGEPLLFKWKDLYLDKSGFSQGNTSLKTGAVAFSSIKAAIGIDGIERLKFDINISISDGKISDINFGDIEIPLQAAQAAPGQPDGKQPGAEAPVKPQSSGDGTSAVTKAEPESAGEADRAGEQRIGNKPPGESFIKIAGIREEDLFVLFCADSADISIEESKKLIEAVRKYCGPLLIEVHGYASTEGPGEYNTNISAHRAVAVKKLLSAFSETEITVYAHGETSGFGRAALNRRVGIRIIDTSAAKNGGSGLPADILELRLDPGLKRFTPDFTLHTFPYKSEIDFGTFKPGYSVGKEPDWAVLSEPFLSHGLTVSDRQLQGMYKDRERAIGAILSLGFSRKTAEENVDFCLSIAYSKFLLRQEPTSYEARLLREEQSGYGPGLPDVQLQVKLDTVLKLLKTIVKRRISDNNSSVFYWDI